MRAHLLALICDAMRCDATRRDHSHCILLTASRVLINSLTSTETFFLLLESVAIAAASCNCAVKESRFARRMICW